MFNDEPTGIKQQMPNNQPESAKDELRHKQRVHESNRCKPIELKQGTIFSSRVTKLMKPKYW